MRSRGKRSGFTTAGGGGGGAAWRTSDLVANPYTSPTGIDAYGVGTVFDTTWNLAGQTGTTHTCTTQAHVTTALGAANPGDKIVINADITAPNGGWVLGNRGAGDIYIVSSYVNAGTFERRASVSDWGTLARADIATEISATRARTSDTYRTVQSDSGVYSGVSGDGPVFRMTAQRSTKWWVSGLKIQPNSGSALNTNGFPCYNLVYIENSSASVMADCSGNVVFDRCYFTALASQSCRNAILNRGVNVAVQNCCITDMHEISNGDSHAVAQDNSGQFFKLVNNTLAASSPALFGGGPTTVALHPCDAEVRFNHCITPAGLLTTDSDHASSPYAGMSGWRSKCGGLEGKLIKRLYCEGNLIQNCRGDGGHDYALEFFSAGQGTGQNFVEVKDTAFVYNRAQKTRGGLSLMQVGVDYTTDTPGNRCFVNGFLATGAGDDQGLAGNKFGMLLGTGTDLTMRAVTMDDSDGATAFSSALVWVGTSAGPQSLSGVVLGFGSYGVTIAGNTGDAATDVHLSSIGWSNIVLYGTNASGSSSAYNTTHTTALLANRAAVGFGNPASNDWQISGTYSANTLNDSLMDDLTNGVNVEGYT